MRCLAALLAAGACACGSSAPREVRGPGAGPVVTAAKPARARLVVAEHAEGGGHLVVIDETGRRVRNLTPPPRDRSADSTPAFSPDGRWVVYASSRGRPSPRETSLWIVPTDGASPPRRLTGDDAIDVTPAFAPGGTELAFGSTRAGDLDVWVVTLDGDLRPGPARRLTTTEDAELQPAWSAGGDLLAWTAVARGGERRVMIAAADGTGARPLAEGGSPEFAPDGGSLVFTARPSGRDDLDLFTIAPDGTGLRHLFDHPLADEVAPRFGDGGRFLFFTAVVRDDDRRALTSTVVCLETHEATTLRALLGPLPISRLGVAAAPVPLESATLRRNPTYREALRRTLVR